MDRLVVLEGLSVVSDVETVGSLETIGHAVVEGEQRGHGTDLSAHVTSCSHSSSRERFDTWAFVFDDSSSSTLDGKYTSDLENDV